MPALVQRVLDAALRRDQADELGGMPWAKGSALDSTHWAYQLLADDGSLVDWIAHEELRSLVEAPRGQIGYRSDAYGDFKLFRFYHQFVSGVYPVGGPSQPAGGPAPNASVRFSGEGLRSLGDDAAALARCRFGDVDVPVTSVAANGSSAMCVAPPVTLPYGGALTTQVSLALNGLHFVKPSPLASYRFYDQRLLRFAPRGGPVIGGSIVTVLGVGFEQLGEEGASVSCSFGNETTPSNGAPMLWNATDDATGNATSNAMDTTHTACTP